MQTKDMGDLLWLPGIVVQEGLSMQGMAVLYGVEIDLLKHLVESTTKPLIQSDLIILDRYKLHPYLSNLLHDQDRPQFYYYDPIRHQEKEKVGISGKSRLLALITANYP